MSNQPYLEPDKLWRYCRAPFRIMLYILVVYFIFHIVKFVNLVIVVHLRNYECFDNLVLLPLNNTFGFIQNSIDDPTFLAIILASISAFIAV